MSNYDLFGDYEPEQPATLEEDWPEPEPEALRSPRSRQAGHGGGSLYNFFSFLFLTATAAVIIVTATLVQNPTSRLNPFPPPPPQPTPTLFLLESGASVGILVPPTPTISPTSTRVPTTLPRVTQSQTTATTTLDAQANPGDLTAQPGVTNTPSIKPFTLQNDAVTYTKHPDGCSGMWIVGQVFDLDGKPRMGLAVIAKWDGGDGIAWPNYGTPWGVLAYEIKVENKPIELEVELQLKDFSGQVLSEPIIVRTLASCEHNVAVANFIQNHVYSP